MNSNSKRLGIYLFIMLILTATATALRTIACVMRLDYASGFFRNRSLITVANVIITLCAIGMLSYALVASRITLRASFSTGATYVPTGILGVASVFLGAKVFSYALTTGRYPFFSVEVFTLKEPSVLLGVIAGVLAILSVAHHFLNAFITDSKATLRAYFAIASISFFTLYSVLIYLDTSLALNDASKVLRQMSFLMCALFFLFEARISLGREKWRLYSAFGLSAAALTTYTSVPALLTYYIKHEIVSSSGARSLASVEEYMLLLALSIFIIARLILTATLKEEKENELIKVLGEYAKDREEKVTESYARHQELFASKQLSIFDLYGIGEETIEEECKVETAEAPACEEEKKEIIISDDAIYESIFGRMPEKEQAPEDGEDDVEQDERKIEEIADDILSTVDELLGESTKDKKEDNDI